MCFVDTMADNGPTYIAACSLIGFLSFLLEKELGEKRWPFDAGYVVDADPDLIRVRDVCLLPWCG